MTHDPLRQIIRSTILTWDSDYGLISGCIHVPELQLEALGQRIDHAVKQLYRSVRDEEIEMLRERTEAAETRASILESKIDVPGHAIRDENQKLYELIALLMVELGLEQFTAPVSARQKVSSGKYTLTVNEDEETGAITLEASSDEE